MKCRLWALVLLAFLGVGGIAGAVPMILSSVRHTPGIMPLSLLRHSPFQSYLVPGMILLVANGLLPLWVYLRLKARRPFSGRWTAAQGCVLLGWLIVQCVMLRLVNWLHAVYCVLALLLIALGWALNRQSDATHAQG